MKKAGNLRYGFGCSSGEFILILDADFAPRADLPAEMLPYFAADARWASSSRRSTSAPAGRMSWMERGAGAVQELFYRLVQVSRDRHDGAICVGSCAIYRRAALEANGGTTLIEHSEDVHTGFDLRRAGWGLRYVPVPLAAGLCPSDPDSFLTQQYRWCAGSMSLLGLAEVLGHAMRWRTRCCYLSGFCYYVHTALFTFVAPAIPLVMLTVAADRVRLANYVFILPSMIYNLVVFPCWHRCRFGPEALMAKLLYGWAHVFALLDICAAGGWAGRPPAAAAQGRHPADLGGPDASGTAARGWPGSAWRPGGCCTGAPFVPLLLTGLIACTITVMALAARRNHARLTEGAS